MKSSWLHRLTYGLPLLGAVALLLFLAFALGQAVHSPQGNSLLSSEAALRPLFTTTLAYAPEWQELAPPPEPLTPATWTEPQKPSERYVLVNFFASWCAPCKAEHAQLMALKDHLPVYGILWRDRTEAAVAWLKQDGIPYRRVGASTEAISDALAITGVPTSFLIDLGAPQNLQDEPQDTTPEERQNTGARICWRGEAPLLGGEDLTWLAFMEAFTACSKGAVLSVPTAE